MHLEGEFPRHLLSAFYGLVATTEIDEEREPDSLYRLEFAWGWLVRWEKLQGSIRDRDDGGNDAPSGARLKAPMGESFRASF